MWLTLDLQNRRETKKRFCDLHSTLTLQSKRRRKPQFTQPTERCIDIACRGSFVYGMYTQYTQSGASTVQCGTSSEICEQFHRNMSRSAGDETDCEGKTIVSAVCSTVPVKALFFSEWLLFFTTTIRTIVTTVIDSRTQKIKNKIKKRWRQKSIHHMLYDRGREIASFENPCYFVRKHPLIQYNLILGCIHCVRACAKLLAFLLQRPFQQRRCDFDWIGPISRRSTWLRRYDTAIYFFVSLLRVAAVCRVSLVRQKQKLRSLNETLVVLPYHTALDKECTVWHFALRSIFQPHFWPNHGTYDSSTPSS